LANSVPQRDVAQQLDSLAGDYQNNASNYVRTPAFDLTGKRHVELSGWFKYALETGYDYVYVEYSLNGGNTWNNPFLASFNGTQDWHKVVIDAAALDNQPNVALRFHLMSDAGVTEDGIYLDDITLSYEPYQCTYELSPNAPTLVSPANGSWTNSPVTFSWLPATDGFPAEGYILYIDDSPAVTLTAPITTTTMDVAPWAHTWFVRATNAAGVSSPSTTWSISVVGNIFLPITRK
jgi:hypothetical protein